MCKSDEYEPYECVTLDEPASDPDVVLWEPSPAADEVATERKLASSAADGQGAAMPPWEPATFSTNEFLWESSAMASAAGSSSWQQPADDAWLWRPDASAAGEADDWKPSYVINDSSDGPWKHSENGASGVTYAVNEGGGWRASTAVADGDGQPPWGTSFAASTNGGILQPAFETNGDLFWGTENTMGWSSPVNAVGNGEAVVKCTECPQEFLSEVLLRSHRLVAHNVHNGRDEPLDIDLPDIDVPDAVVPNAEMTSAMTAAAELPIDVNKPHRCSKCGKAFTTPYSLRRHLAVHGVDSHEGKEVTAFNCDLCNPVKSFGTLYCLRRHHGIVHRGEPAFKCDLCLQRFFTPDDMRGHLVLAHGVEPAPSPPPLRATTIFSCDICPRSFVAADRYNAHVLEHKGVLPFVCDQCPKAFSTADLLNRHMTRAHDKRYACPVCQRKFGFLNEVKRHMRCHSGMAPTLLCTLCPRTVCSFRSLHRHYVQVHGIAEPFRCVCGQGFDAMRSLENHQRMACAGAILPPGQESHGCVTCGLVFGDAITLGNHLFSHIKLEIPKDPQAARGARCAACGAAFKTRACLLAHAASAHGAKQDEQDPFFCTDCEARFGSEANLAQHCRDSHGVQDGGQDGLQGERQKFSCSVCVHRFDQHGDLLRHLNRHLGRC